MNLTAHNGAPVETRHLSVVSAELAQAVEADVKREIARELHDDVVQTLTSILLDMERFKMEQFGRVSVISEVTSLQHSVRTTLQQIRALLLDLRNQPLTTTDFIESVRMDLAAKFEARTGVPVSVRVSPEWPAALPTRTALNLHRAIQEALNNIRIHAAAKSVRIELDVAHDRSAVLTINDDGIGADDQRTNNGSELGILGMRERAILLGGDLSIESRPGQGTTVRLTMPATSLE